MPFCLMKNRKFYKLFLIFLIKIMLEEVLPHPTRIDLYIDQIVTSYEEVKESDKKLINRILLKEIARESIELVH